MALRLQREQARSNLTPPLRRKVLFEALEARLLLSADPLASLASDGLLRLNLTDGDDQVVVRQVGEAGASGAILDLTRGAITERYGADGAGVREILAEGGGGDDTFRFLAVTIAARIDGGAGSDWLLGPDGDTQWDVTGWNSGIVGSLEFTDVENLRGAADNRDTFTLHEGGRLDGLVDGGASGFDSLVIADGSYATASYAPSGPQSGSLDLDGASLSFAGLEPIDLLTPVADFTFDFSATPFVSPGGSTDGTDQILVRQLASDASKTEIYSSNGTFEHVRIANPTNSLTIRAAGGADSIVLESLGNGFAADLSVEGGDGDDQISVIGDLDLGDGAFSASAESISVTASGSIVTTGDVTLTALAENNLAGSLSPAAIAISASILVDGEMNVGGSLKLEATVNNTVDLDASGASLAIESQSNAVAQIGSTARVDAANLTVSAVTNTNFSVDVTDATGGGSGLGAEVVEADRNRATLLGEDGPAKFYLWDSPSLDLDADTYVVTHGWRDGLDGSWIDLLNSLEAYDAGANVIFTDWSESAKNPVYPQAADATFEIGGLLADFLAASLLDPFTTTLIGHSLGGQVSGIAADQYAGLTGDSIARVIALDPAGPFFEPTLGFDAKPLDRRLDAGDADRVVALHTTSILGYDAPVADLDLYVNPDTPLQPGEANFVGNHSYAVTLLTELLQGDSFSQTPGSLVGDELDFGDLLDPSLVGSVDVATYDSPIEVTTVASIEGGAQIVVGTTPISPTESASLLVQATDNSNLHSSITTGTLSDQTIYDFVQGKIGLNRDTRAYIGDDAHRTTLSNAGGSAAGVVIVSAQSLGNVDGEVFSDFLDYRSTAFARESLLAYVENADLNVERLEVSAGSASTYTTVAEENSNTVRGVAKAYINASTVTAGAAGVALSAADDSSYTAISQGEGGRMSLNDIRNDVSAYVTGSTIAVTGGSIGISADNRTALEATATLSASSANFSTADIFAINVANGDVDAYAQNSTLTTTGAGSISLAAGNEETIDAKVKGDATAASNAIGPSPTLTLGAGMAFNAVGWDMANILLATVGDFLGDLGTQWLEGLFPFAESTPAKARAYLLDTDVDAAGDLTLHASSAPQINATVSNAAESTASSLFGTLGGSAGGVLASNKISSTAGAWIDYSDTYTHSPGADDVTAGGAISILASDNAGVYANTKLTATSVTTNDGGASLLGGAVSSLVPTDFHSDDGIVDIAFGDRVLLADEFGAEDYSSSDGEVALASGDLVRLADDYATPVFTSESGVRLLRAGDVVQLADGYPDAHGTPGGLYRFVGAGGRGLRVDLSAQDYTDPALWQAIGGNNGSVYEYVGAAATHDLADQDYADTNLWREIVGAPGEIYQYMGEDTNNFNLGQADFGDLGLWKREPVTQLVPTGTNLTASDSMAIGAAIVFNEVRSDVDAHVREAKVTAGGSVDVQAIESAVIRAVTDSLSTSSGGSAFGTGNSLAVDATIATNVVLSEADAYIEASEVTTTNALDGEIGILAQNVSQIDADTRAAAISGENSAPFLLAFNTVGWEAQDLFSNTLDALLGMTALGQEQPARVAAYFLDTHVQAAGGLTITADSSAQINALVTNDATSFPAAFFGAAGLSASGILSSNMVSSTAKAYIEFSDTYTHAPVDVDAAGAVAISALDNAAIDAKSKLYAEVSPTNDAASGLLNNLAGTLMDDYKYTSASGTRDLQFGDRVLVTDDYYPPDFEVDGSEQLATLAAGNVVRLTDDYDGDGGTAGSLYKLIGPAPAGAIDLGSEDFTDTGRWVQVGGTYQYMGTSASGANADLGAQDYTDFGTWKRLNPANLITDSTVYAALSVVGTVTKKEGLTGDSTSYYGLIDRNDVRSEVLSYIDNANVRAAGDLASSALESAWITALEDSYVVPWTGIGGIIATNAVLSKADAYITDSDVETTAGGDVILDAQNLSRIDATTTSKIEAWDSKSAVVAFNSIGWKSQNILFNALDALMGDPLISSAFNGEQAAEVQAYVLDSTVDAAGDLTLNALSMAQINSFVGNQNISEASLDIVIPGVMEDASGVAGGGVLASNKVSSFAKAYIEFTATPGQVDAGGAISVHAEDTAGISSESVVTQRAVASNTLSGVVDQVEALLPGDYDFTTRSGVRSLEAYNGALLLPGVRVRIASDYDETKGDRGAVYEYRGGGAVDLDLGTQNYNDPNGPWHKLVGGADSLEDLYPNIGNLTESDATAVGILVVLNDVRSSVDSHLTGVNATAANGDLLLSALENAVLQAHAESNVTASGGSFYGTGTVLAVNGQVTTNLVQSQANASILNSTVAARDPNVSGAGNIGLSALNTLKVDATLLVATDTGDTGVGVTLAFNTLGWGSQNVLFNTVDAIIGSSEIADAFGLENPARATATIVDSSVDADGDLTLTAASDAQLNATVSNAASSVASALYGASGKSVGAVVASNKVSSAAQAYIDYADAGALGSVQVGRTLTISAQDNSGLFANSKLVSSSVTTNDGGAAILQETLNDFLDADFLSSEGSREIDFGERVRLTDDYDPSLGAPGAVYQYMGTTQTLDLAGADYTDLGLWKPVPGTNLVPQGFNISESDAMGLGGLVVLNELRSRAQSWIDHADVDAGTVALKAIENAALQATADSSSTASGGSAFGTGSVLAVNGTIATNVVLSQANAYVSGSDVTTTLGDLIIDAKNTSQIDAKTLSATTSGDTGVGVILAFNTIGWQAQNVLFNTLDALLGDPLIASAFGNADAAQVQAYILDSSVHAAGAIRLSALNQAQLNAEVGNEATSAAAALYGANATTGAGVLASNMVNSQAQAYIRDTDALAGRTVQAGGEISIDAEDSAGIDAHTRMAALSSASNDGGAGILNSLAQNLIDDYQYTTKSGTRSVTFGQQVRVAEDYDPAKGTAGKVYQYMGTSASRDLGAEDYTDYELWKELDTDNVIPTAVSTAALKAFGLDTGNANTYYGLVTRNDVRGAVASFIDTADVTAFADVGLTAIEGAHLSAQEDSVASAKTAGKGGAIATNALQSNANAYIVGSEVTSTAGGLLLDARNTAQIDASALTASSAKESVGVVVAFNQIGWSSSNIFFQAIDALLGTTLLGGENPVHAQAYILDSTVDAAGEISLTAQSTAHLNATVGNEQVAHKANEFVIDAKFGASGMSASALLASNKASSQAKAYIDDTDPAAGRTIHAGGGMTISAHDDASIDSDSKVVASSVTSNTLDALKDIAKTLGLNDYQYTTGSGTVALEGGENVRLGASYANGGDTGAVYRYLGGPATLDLGAVDYTATDPATGDPLWEKFAGGAADPTDLLFPNIGNLTDSDARAFGFLVVMNDVRGAVQASIDHAKVIVDGGDLTLEAIENATMAVAAETNVTASGGSFYGSGTVVAGGGQAVTNVVLASADAFITDSDITMGAGDVSLDASDTARIDAILLTSTASSDTAVGVAVAFNTIGWQSQNILFNTIDALIGDPAIANAFGGQQPAEANAYVSGGTITGAGDLTLDAVNAAQLNATVSNAARSTASALFGAVGKGIGGVLASNKVASGAHAYLEAPAAALTLGGALTISAEDNAGIFANSKIVSSSITTNDGGAAVIQETLNDLIPADFLSGEGSREIEFGERVRLTDDYGTPNYTVEGLIPASADLVAGDIV
jgi:Lipase